MKVFILDASIVLQERLAYMLAEVQDVELLGQARDGFQGGESILKLKPDVVIMDIRVPGGGAELVGDIKKNTPPPRVMVLTMYPCSPVREECLGAGADFCLDKCTEVDRVKSLLEQMIEDSHGLSTPGNEQKTKE